jgi:hypothetical protein
MNLRGGRVVSATTVFTWHRRDASVTYDGQVAATVASDIKEALVCARDDASGAAEAISAYEVAKGLVRHRPMLRRQGGLPGRRIGRAAIPRLTRQPRRAAVAHHRHVATSRAADVEKLASGHDEVSRSPDAMATDKVVEVRHGSLRRHRRVGIRTIYTPSSHPRQRQPRPPGVHAAADAPGPSQDGNRAVTGLYTNARDARFSGAPASGGGVAFGTPGGAAETARRLPPAETRGGAPHGSLARTGRHREPGAG